MSIMNMNELSNHEHIIVGIEVGLDREIERYILEDTITLNKFSIRRDRASELVKNKRLKIKDVKVCDKTLVGINGFKIRDTEEVFKPVKLDCFAIIALALRDGEETWNLIRKEFTDKKSMINKLGVNVRESDIIESIDSIYSTKVYREHAKELKENRELIGLYIKELVYSVDEKPYYKDACKYINRLIEIYNSGSNELSKDEAFKIYEEVSKIHGILSSYERNKCNNIESQIELQLDTYGVNINKEITDKKIKGFIVRNRDGYSCKSIKIRTGHNKVVTELKSGCEALIDKEEMLRLALNMLPLRKINISIADYYLSNIIYKNYREALEMLYNSIRVNESYTGKVVATQIDNKKVSKLLLEYNIVTNKDIENHVKIKRECNKLKEELMKINDSSASDVKRHGILLEALKVSVTILRSLKNNYGFSK